LVRRCLVLKFLEKCREKDQIPEKVPRPRNGVRHFIVTHLVP